MAVVVYNDFVYLRLRIVILRLRSLRQLKSASRRDVAKNSRGTRVRGGFTLHIREMYHYSRLYSKIQSSGSNWGKSS